MEEVSRGGGGEWGAVLIRCNKVYLLLTPVNSSPQMWERHSSKSP